MIRTEYSTLLLPVHNLMVVQKLEAQHDAGSIESAGGEDDNIKLVTEQREVYKDSLLTMSSRSRPSRPYNQTMAAVALQLNCKMYKLKVQVVNMPRGNMTRSG